MLFKKISTASRRTIILWANYFNNELPEGQISQFTDNHLSDVTIGNIYTENQTSYHQKIVDVILAKKLD